MEFKVETHYKNEFSKLLASTCKKFKVDYTVEFSAEQEIGTRTVVDNRGMDWGGSAITFGSNQTTYPINGFIVTVTVPEIERVEETGFKYLGCVKDSDMISVHPTKYAEEKGFQIASMKEEINTFPCVECGKKITRKIIHVFESPEGDIAVYGSGCAVKKFGINFSAVMDKFYNAIQVLEEGYYGDEEYFGGGSWGTPIYGASFFTFMAFFNIYNRGYVSGSKAWNEGGISTKDCVIGDMNTIMDADKKSVEFIKLTEQIETFNETNKLDYDEFIAWLPEFKAELNLDEDFGFNMNAVSDMLISGQVSGRMAGYAVYVVFRYWQVVLAPKAPKTEYNTDYSGFKVGDKLKDLGPIKVEIVGVYRYETDFGTKSIYTMRDLENGYKFKWFATVFLDEGVNYEIYSGTIKGLEDDAKYGKAIVLTRCRCNQIEEVDAS